MRIIRFFLSYVLVNIFVLLVATFLAQNVHVEHLAFFGLNVQTNFVWIMVGAAGFGFLVAFALLIPGRVIVSLRVWELDREAGQLEQQVALLEEQREDLICRHEVLIQAREHALDRYHRLKAEYNQLLARQDEPRVQAGYPKMPTSRPKASTAELEAASAEPEPPIAKPSIASGPARLVEQLALPQRLQRLQRLLPALPGSSVID